MRNFFGENMKLIPYMWLYKKVTDFYRIFYIICSDHASLLPQHLLDPPPLSMFHVFSIPL